MNTATIVVMAIVEILFYLFMFTTTSILLCIRFSSANKLKTTDKVLLSGWAMFVVGVLYLYYVFVPPFDINDNYSPTIEQQYQQQMVDSAYVRQMKTIKKYKLLSSRGMIDAYIDKISKDMKLNPKIVKALIYAESGYDTTAVGKAGELGLMQIKLSTARIFNPELKKKELMNWRTNIYYGCLYLRMQIKQHGIKRGILSYNGGSTILKHKINGKYINEKYYKKVMYFYHRM